MEKIFQLNFQDTSNLNLKRVKESITTLSKDELNTAEPKLLKEFHIEKIAIENDELKFEKQIQIIKLDAGGGYSYRSNIGSQFAAVSYKIPVVKGKTSTLLMRPSNCSQNYYVTEEINVDD